MTSDNDEVDEIRLSLCSFTISSILNCESQTLPSKDAIIVTYVLMKDLRYFHFQIGRNPIGDGGVECLLNIIRTNNTIKFLSLDVRMPLL